MRDQTAPAPAYAGATENTYPPLTPREKSKLLLSRLLFGALPLLILILAVGGMMAMGALKPEPEAAEDPIKAVPVLTVSAQRESVALSVNVQGEVQPRTTINLVPQVAGRISYMSPKFIDGGAFRRGEVLVRIDPAEYDLRVVQARAQVAQAETVVTRELSEGQIARQDWQELGRAGEPTALTLREPQLAEARAQLAAAQARLAEAELQLSRTTLSAPFDGRVTERHVDGGEFVNAGTRLGEIYAVNVMDVRLPLTNAELARAGLTLGYVAKTAESGIPVTLSADVAGRPSRWQARIVRTDSRYDSRSRVLYAYAEVRDPFGAGSDDGVPLAPGLFVDARIAGRTLDDVVTIPRAALRGEASVYVVGADGETMSVRDVSVISSNRERVVLSDGLARGEAVVTSPVRGAADGMKVAVVDSLSDVAPTTETIQ